MKRGKKTEKGRESELGGRVMRGKGARGKESLRDRNVLIVLLS